MREEEEPKKRSWFSRKKKPATSNQSVSRPPSAASFPSHHRKTSSQSTLDDDLPPREGQPVSAVPGADPSLATPIPGTPAAEDVQGDIGTPDAANLPKTAGFDFAAIKGILGESERDPAKELQMRAPSASHFQMPSIPAPTLRSESAPPPIPEESSSPSPPTPRSPSQAHDLPIAGPSSSRPDLSATLSRSLSLNDMRGQADDDEMMSSSERTPSAHTFRAPAPLAFGSTDGTFWPAEPDRLAPFGTDSFGAYGREPYTASRASFGSYGSVARPSDSLAFSPPDTESSGLAFGGADGSITFVPSPSVRADPPDPWTTPAPAFGAYSAKKASSSLNVSNPWQS